MQAQKTILAAAILTLAALPSMAANKTANHPLTITDLLAQAQRNQTDRSHKVLDLIAQTRQNFPPSTLTFQHPVRIATDQGIITLGGEEPLQRFPQLWNRVDLKLSNATVREAVKALSKAANVRIDVDPQVPDDRKLNIEAHNVYLHNILDSIAGQMDLDIEPGDKAIVLKPWPSLNVNGRLQVFRTDAFNSPWSENWHGMPADPPPFTLNRTLDGFKMEGGDQSGGFHFSNGGYGAPSDHMLVPYIDTVPKDGNSLTVPKKDLLVPHIEAAPQDETPKPGKLVPYITSVPKGGDPAIQKGVDSLVAPKKLQGPYFETAPDSVSAFPSERFLASPGGSVSVTALGNNQFVVAQPGFRSPNEPGVWLTVYVWNAGKLSSVSRTFCPAAGE